MKITITVQEIKDIFKTAASFASSKMFAFTNLYMETGKKGLLIRSSNEHIEYAALIPATPEAEGKVGVSASQMHKLISKLPDGEVTLTQEDTKLTIKQGKKRYSLPTSDTILKMTFASLQSEGDVSSAICQASELHNTIARVQDFTGELAGIDCVKIAREDDQVTMAGLDGHKMGYIKTELNGMAAILEDDILIASILMNQALRWLNKLGDASVATTFDAKRMFMQTVNADTNIREELSIPLQADTKDFPNLSVIVSKVADKKNVLQMDRLEMLTALDRLSIFTSKENRGVTLSPSENELAMDIEHSGTGKAGEVVPAFFEGKLDKITFPVDGLMAILSKFTSDTINFNFTAEMGPCSIAGADGDEGYLCIIMPMKTNDNSNYEEEEVEERQAA